MNNEEKRKALESVIQTAQSLLDEMKEEQTPSLARWKPNPGKRYFYVDSIGSVLFTGWSNDVIDEYRYASGNCFQTEKEAFAHKERTLATQRVYDRIREIGGGEFVTWSDDRNFTSYYDHKAGCVSLFYCNDTWQNVKEIFCQDKAALKRLINDPAFISDYKLMLGIKQVAEGI